MPDYIPITSSKEYTAKLPTISKSRIMALFDSDHDGFEVISNDNTNSGILRKDVLLAAFRDKRIKFIYDKSKNAYYIAATDKRIDGIFYPGYKSLLEPKQNSYKRFNLFNYIP